MERCHLLLTQLEVAFIYYFADREILLITLVMVDMAFFFSCGMDTCGSFAVFDLRTL